MVSKLAHVVDELATLFKSRILENIIEIYNMKQVKLKYCGLAFNSAEVLPSIEQIEHSFGATHPGVYDTEKQLFVLNFRGLSFCFPVESKFQNIFRHGNVFRLFFHFFLPLFIAGLLLLPDYISVIEGTSSSAAMYSYVQSRANLCHVSSSHGRVKVRGANEGTVDGPGRGSLEGPDWELASTGGGSSGFLVLAVVGSTWMEASSLTGRTTWACWK
uniref:(California timema) hypothetical protein n=1 Tax=Timema californicum TaxID=61474 RepID=A0A7R9J141_TIMCA|nr:unnamed protein product [Timema californicum]